MRTSITFSITLFFMTAVFLIMPGLHFAQSKAHGTVRDFFKLIPSEYFSIVCCDGDVEEFLEKHATVEDAANGYLAGQDLDNDPKYGGFEMALFKRPDGRHIVGFYSYAMRWYDFYFLEYRNGKLVNISTTIPGYSQKHYYQFPRKGTTIGVYRKKYDDSTAPIGVDNSVTKGRKLYDLVWQKENSVSKNKLFTGVAENSPEKRVNKRKHADLFRADKFPKN